MGDHDWVQFLDIDDQTDVQWGEHIIMANQTTHGTASRFHWLPNSGHNIENSIAFLAVLLRECRTKKEKLSLFAQLTINEILSQSIKKPKMELPLEQRSGDDTEPPVQ